MATRKKIPLITSDATLTIGAGKTLSTSVNLDVSGADVDIVGSGSAVITFPTTTSTLATIDSPTFTGTPATPTVTAGDSTTRIASTAFVQQAVRSTPGKEASEYATTAVLPTVVYNNGSSGVGATLTAVGVGALSLDGQSPIVSDRILVKNQASSFQNGIYLVTATGSGIAVFVMTRALDFNETGDIKTGAATYVVGGTTQAGTTWDVNSADSPVMGTDAITFIQSAGPGSVIAGTGISISGSTVAIDTATTVDKTTAQTLTNKTLTSPKINEAVALTSTATELNILDGATLTTTELNYVDGVTSAIQTQINAKGVGTWTDSSTSTGSNKTFVAPALGTPASGVMTNVTGTAANLTAGTVTTNANLTGDVTSSGNATTIAWTRNPYCFRAYASGGTTLTDNAAVKIALATEEYDYNSNFTDSTYTAPVAGVYHFDASVVHASVSVTPVNAYSMIYKNGAVVVYSDIKLASTTLSSGFPLSSDLLLAANDTVELWHFQNSAGNEASIVGSAYTYLSGHLVHRTA